MFFSKYPLIVETKFKSILERKKILEKKSRLWKIQWSGKKCNTGEKKKQEKKWLQLQRTKKKHKNKCLIFKRIFSSCFYLVQLFYISYLLRQI